MTCRSRNCTRQAFTLAEVVLALGLLSIIALGLMSLFVSSRVSSQGGTARVEAIQLAAQEMDQAKRRPYNELVALTTTPLPPYSVSFHSQPYQVSLTVQRSGSNPSLLDYDLLELQVVVSWEQKDRLDYDGGKTLSAGKAIRQVTLNSLVAPGAGI